MFAEGVLNPNNCVLNIDIGASEAQPLSGEAPPALLVEGVLNPDSCVLNPVSCRASALLWYHPRVPHPGASCG